MSNSDGTREPMFASHVQTNKMCHYVQQSLPKNDHQRIDITIDHNLMFTVLSDLGGNRDLVGEAAGNARADSFNALHTLRPHQQTQIPP